MTTPPKEACKIIKGAEGTSLHKWSEQSVPVTVGALDIGLRQLQSYTSICIRIRSTYIFHKSIESKLN